MSQGSAKKTQLKTPQRGSTKKVLRSRSRSQSRSPVRQIKAKPVKSQNQLKKIEKRDNFNTQVDLLFKQHRNLVKLHERFAKAKTCHNLTFQKNGESRTLTKLELSYMDQEFEKLCPTVKKLYVEGTKHSKAQNLPESFKAAYTPVKIGPVFTALLGVDSQKKFPNFGPVPNGDSFLPKSNLLDSLPRAKEGYVLKTSLTLLMYIYCTVNNLKSKEPSEGQKNIPDSRLNNVFGSLNSLYYQEVGQPKVLMSKSGHKLSTYAVVSGKNNQFNPEKIENYYFQAIQSLNIYDVVDLNDTDTTVLLSDSLRAELLEEFKIIKAANNLHKLNKKV